MLQLPANGRIVQSIINDVVCVIVRCAARINKSRFIMKVQQSVCSDPADLVLAGTASAPAGTGRGTARCAATRSPGLPDLTGAAPAVS